MSIVGYELSEDLNSDGEGDGERDVVQNAEPRRYESNLAFGKNA